MDMFYRFETHHEMRLLSNLATAATGIYSSRSSVTQWPGIGVFDGNEVQTVRVWQCFWLRL